jgi:tetratricopeptide (TPR) repeat protein
MAPLTSPNKPGRERGRTPIQIDEEKARKALADVLAFPPIGENPRSRDFLSYVVKRTLAGESSQVKEYSVGVDVFSRGADFDPKVDSVVRNEARRLRAKLHDYYSGPGASDPVRIVLSKGGYVPDFVVVPEAQPPVQVNQPPVARRWRMTIAASFIAVVVAIAVIWGLAIRFRPSGGQPVRVAIIPFSGSGIPQLDSGLTEEIKDDLSRLPELRVLAQVPSGVFHPDKPDYAELGKRTGASVVLLGEFQRSNGSGAATLHTHLIRTSDGSYLWAGEWSIGEDAALLRNSIVQGVARALSIKRAIPAQPSGNAKARELYMEGRFLWRTRHPGEIKQAIQLYQQALAIDPGYAEADMGLADAYALLAANGWMDPETAVLLGLKFGQKAAELDPASGETHAAMGLLHYSHFDWQESENELHQAIELSPSYGLAYLRLALVRSARGDFAAADQLLGKAQDLDPFSAAIRCTRAQVSQLWGHYDRAIELANDVLRVEPNFEAHQSLAEAYFSKGEFGRALQEAELWATYPDGASGLLMRVGLLRVYVRTKGRQYARDLFNRLERMNQDGKWVDPMPLAQGAMALDDREKAIHYLQVAQEKRIPDVTSARWDPQFAALRPDARFQAIFRDLRLQ